MDRKTYLDRAQLRELLQIKPVDSERAESSEHLTEV
jgi:hypothetical protein